MSTDEASIWDVLDVPPGSDTARIRRAYAKKLKEIHPEDDPQGFQYLRAAYEAALNFTPGAVAVVIKTAPPPPPPAAPPLAAHPPPPAAPPAPRPRPADAAPPDFFRKDQARYRQNMIRLTVALKSNHASDAERLAALEDVLQSPLLENLSLSLEIESEIIDLLARNVPRSDQAIERAFAHFHWDQAIHRHNWPQSMEIIQQRIVAWAYIHDVSNPHHPLHTAWRFLSGEPCRRIYLCFHAAELAEKTAIIRRVAQTHLPGLIWSFDSAALAYCDNYFTQTPLNYNIVIAVLLILAAGGSALMAIAGQGLAIIGVLCVVAGLLAMPWLLSGGGAWLQRRMVWHRPPDWVMNGWLPAALALPFLATVWPPWLWPMVVVGLAAAIVNIWIVMAMRWLQPVIVVNSPWRILPRLWWNWGLVASIGTFRLTGQYRLVFLFVIFTALTCKVTARAGMMVLLNNRFPQNRHRRIVYLATWAPPVLGALLAMAIGNLDVLVYSFWMMLALETIVLEFMQLIQQRQNSWYTHMLNSYVIIGLFIGSYALALPIVLAIHPPERAVTPFLHYRNGLF